MLSLKVSLSLLVLAFASNAFSETQGNPETRKVMHEIFNSIKTVLPLSLDRKKFSAKENKKTIAAALQSLSTHAEVLTRHAKGQNNAFSYLSTSLAADAKRTHQWYANGRFDEARFYVHNITENCISCHSKLPANQNFAGAGAFFSEQEVAELSPWEKLWFKVATRQFDEALSDYESMLLQNKSDLPIVMGTALFSDYLKLSLRVKSDYQRPAALIKELRGRATTPESRRLAESYLTSLAVAENVNKSAMGQLEKGRILLRKATHDKDLPFERANLVYYVAGSAALNQFIDTLPEGKGALSEAYYLLAIAEEAIGRSFWISETEHFWEYAIRVDPSSVWARKSYDLLKEHLTVEFSGSAGTFVPSDVKELLDELKKLIDANPMIQG